MTITAKDIEALLAQKHSEDVFVPECKDGPTTMGSHLRMDVWAMNRSWTRACVSAYEIKVSRSDFLQDEKWHGYLPLCNRFAFVCPHGMIQPEELPPEVGLFWVAKTGTRLFTKRKPQHRDIEIPERVFRYILMCRATIKSAWNERDEETSREFWERWLQEKKLNADLGRRVSRAVSEVLHGRIRDVEDENLRLKRRCDGYEEVRQFLSELGIDPSTTRTYMLRAQLQRKLEEAGDVVPRGLVSRLARASEELKEVSGKLEKIATNRSETA